MSRSVVHDRVETAKMKIHCVVKGYHECLFDIEVGEHLELSKENGSREQALKVCNTRGQLGHIQGELVPFLWPIADGSKCPFLCFYYLCKSTIPYLAFHVILYSLRSNQ